jgi:hypothetical protein
MWNLTATAPGRHARAKPAGLCDGSRQDASVEASETVQCPFCGQPFDLVLDTSVASQQFTTDCEICCRPFEVFAECEPGEILSLDVRGN